MTGWTLAFACLAGLGLVSAGWFLGRPRRGQLRVASPKMAEPSALPGATASPGTGVDAMEILERVPAVDCRQLLEGATVPDGELEIDLRLVGVQDRRRTIDRELWLRVKQELRDRAPSR